MNRKKIIGLVSTVTLCTSLAIGGTLAYFTDEDAAVNTFTVGDVDIELEEPSWEQEEGGNTLLPSTEYKKDPTITVQSDSQPSYIFLEMKLDNHKKFINLMGVNNATVLNSDEDPSNDVKFDSNTYYDEFVAGLKNKDEAVLAVVSQWFGGIDYSKWEVITSQDSAESGTIVLGYIGDGTSEGAICNAGDEIVFMKTFGMPGTITKDMIETAENNANIYNGGKPFNMTFNAAAIQAEGIYQPELSITEILTKAYQEI